MKDLKIIYSLNPVFKKCPSCGSAGTLHRSRSRNALEHLIKKLTFYKIYRCKSCGWRGYLSSFVITKRSFINLFIYIMLILGTVYIIRFTILRYVLN